MIIFARNIPLDEGKYKKSYKVGFKFKIMLQILEYKIFFKQDIEMLENGIKKLQISYYFNII